MIGQIDIEKSLLNAPNDRSLFVALASVVNSLVDAVNTIQKERETERFEIQEWIDILEAVRKSVNIHEKQIDELQTRSENVQPDVKIRSENVQDPTKWIGKLCSFWDIDNNYLYYGPLTKIHDTGLYCYECNHRVCYVHCEPVLPDDNIIYKGDDNETLE